MKTNNICLLFVSLILLLYSQNVFSKVNPPDQVLDVSDLNIPNNKYDSKRMLSQIKSLQSAEIESDSYRILKNIFLGKKRPPGEKKIVVDPVSHTWHAYNANGKLIRSGIATAGGKWCSDVRRACKTKAGTFRVFSLGNSSCISSKYPIERGGGAPMPYCMFFNGGQGLHGSYNVVRGNVSHGCVRLTVNDARWLRYNFISIGTKVIVKPY